VILALDAQYDDARRIAGVGAVLFERWADTVRFGTATCTVTDVAPYEPGAFYKRELPCLLRILDVVTGRFPMALAGWDDIDAIVIDGYVDLADGKPGLGRMLHRQLEADGRPPIHVVGIAKTRFHGAPAVEVLRGSSKVPLHVSAAGTGSPHAAVLVRTMGGEHRVPVMVRHADWLAREALRTALAAAGEATHV
jgi:deoxyribonuclease V